MKVQANAPPRACSVDSAPLLEVEDLRVTLATARGPLHAVRGVDLTVARGRTLCLVGESGCGKSMTALALMGLLPRTATRTSGKMRFDGSDFGAQRAVASLRGRRIAMIFQEPMTSLNPSFTIGDQLTEGARRQLGLSRQGARERAVQLLGRVGITNGGERLRQYPHELSGGLRQRVMIAMALMPGPDLVIADEPTTALDVTIQAQILRLLKQLQADVGIALLLVTHDLGVVAQMADDVAVMYAGAIVERGPVAAVLGRPSHPYTRGLLACLPEPGRTRRGQPLGTIAGTVPSLIGDLSGCQFRPRCPHAAPACEGDFPWQHGAPGHRWHCTLLGGGGDWEATSGRGTASTREAASTSGAAATPGAASTRWGRAPDRGAAP
ncbi:MAG: ABC transporter ATP-binding protein [Burkholderiaceae bacterium]